MLEGMVFRLDYNTKVIISTEKDYSSGDCLINVVLKKLSASYAHDFTHTETFTVDKNYLPDFIKALQTFNNTFPEE